MWGDPSIKRDHIYVKDVVSALLAAVRSKNAKGIYNIASGVGYSQYDEALVLAEVFGKEGQKSKVVLRPELPGLTRGYVYDISKAERELKWKPEFSDLTRLYTDYKKEWESKRYHNYHKILESQRPATL